jgi:hypothetical protein
MTWLATWHCTMTSTIVVCQIQKSTRQNATLTESRPLQCNRGRKPSYTEGGSNRWQLVATTFACFKDGGTILYVLFEKTSGTLPPNSSGVMSLFRWDTALGGETLIYETRGFWMGNAASETVWQRWAFENEAFIWLMLKSEVFGLILYMLMSLLEFVQNPGHGIFMQNDHWGSLFSNPSRASDSSR